MCSPTTCSYKVVGKCWPSTVFQEWVSRKSEEWINELQPQVSKSPKSTHSTKMELTLDNNRSVELMREHMLALWRRSCASFVYVHVKALQVDYCILSKYFQV